MGDDTTQKWARNLKQGGLLLKRVGDYRKHSTAQHSTALRNQPGQIRQASIYTCRSQCDNASKQTESIHGIAVPQAQHSAAQSARTQPQSKHVTIRVRQRKQAGRVGERPNMYVSYHIPGIQHADFS